MTDKELLQLYYLNKEVKHLKERILELECVAARSSARFIGISRDMLCIVN